MMADAFWLGLVVFYVPFLVFPNDSTQDLVAFGHGAFFAAVFTITATMA